MKLTEIMESLAEDGKKAWEEGYKARKNTENKSSLANPHPYSDSAESLYAKWMAGWRAATPSFGSSTTRGGERGSHSGGSGTLWR